MLKRIIILVTTAIFFISMQAQQIGEYQKLIAQDGTGGDVFGRSVSTSGDWLIIGASWDDDNGEYSGSAYIFNNNNGEWEQQAKLLPSDGVENQTFGFSVSIWDNFAVVGAPGDNENGEYSGAAYVFQYDSGIWEQKAKLLAMDGEADDIFGNSVSIYGDYIMIGAPWKDEAILSDGATYIFQNINGVWEQQTKLVETDSIWTYSDEFGISVCVSEDYAIIGAQGVSINGGVSGAAYIFHNNSGNWEKEARLLATDGLPGDFFGSSVSISQDRALIGAYGRDDYGWQTGCAYVFQKNSGGWEQQVKLLASDAGAQEWFGFSVCISGDQLIVGADKDDDNNYDAGSAYIFVFNSGEWVQKVKLMASDGYISDYFGGSVAILNDFAFVGASGNDENGEDAGAVYVFESPLITNTDDQYQNNDIILYPNPAKDVINIRTNEIIRNISIYDYSGQLNSAIKTDNSSSQIDITKLTNGIYILKIDTESSVFSSKFIKK